MAQSKLNDLAGKFKSGGPPGLGIGLKLLGAVGLAAYGASQSVYTGGKSSFRKCRSIFRQHCDITSRRNRNFLSMDTVSKSNRKSLAIRIPKCEPICLHSDHSEAVVTSIDCCVILFSFHLSHLRPCFLLFQSRAVTAPSCSADCRVSRTRLTLKDSTSAFLGSSIPLSMTSARDPEKFRLPPARRISK